MNKSLKEIYVAVANNNIVYANTCLNRFVKGMKLYIPDMDSRNTLKKKLDESGVAYYNNKVGTPYAIYYYKNSEYRGIKNV
ncbi:hypothetical protein [Aequorivita sp. CIP111184]|uniref:hypothetical protein n=1 Tax=Aequorivita sp. CIP111184 TaxID=2211356 RepID=UPI000DBC35AB|nr:hypothetical protein [Aequorivita sp. CIP111184]SRX52742.1 hypothetical protein AEQU1_00612 [Aequorivita sp. CIP111184]